MSHPRFISHRHTLNNPAGSWPPASHAGIFKSPKIKGVRDFVCMNTITTCTRNCQHRLFVFLKPLKSSKAFFFLPSLSSVIITSSSEYRTSITETPWSRQLTLPEISAPLRLEAAGLKCRLQTHFSVLTGGPDTLLTPDCSTDWGANIFDSLQRRDDGWKHGAGMKWGNI